MNDLATIQFHDDELLATQIDGKPFILLKRAFEAIGLQPHAQIARLQQHPWAVTRFTRATGPDGKDYQVVAADVRTFLMHLASIPVSRVAEEVRPKLLAYQCEVADVIEAHFAGPKHAEPSTVTWAELAMLMRQRYGLDLEVSEITRGLRDAGVLKQDTATPKKKFSRWFWFTGSAYTVFPHVIPELTHLLVKTRKALGDMQSQLQLELVLDEQLRIEMGRDD